MKTQDWNDHLTLLSIVTLERDGHKSRVQAVRDGNEEALGDLITCVLCAKPDGVNRTKVLAHALLSSLAHDAETERAAPRARRLRAAVGDFLSLPHSERGPATPVIEEEE